MKDKNGYTLSEVLAVITIIGLIAVLTVSVAVRLLEQSRKKISDYDKKILEDAAVTYGEDLDKNNKEYKLTENITIGDVTLNKNEVVTGYKIKEIVNDKKTLPISTQYLYENGYIDKKMNINCTVNISFDTSIQDGYIVIDKISAKLGEDC